MITGVTQAEASTASFSKAVIESVSEVLGLSPGAVTGDVVIGNRRSLLSSISILYNVRVISEMSSSTVIRQLQRAMSSGAFLSLLISKTNLPITSLSTISIIDATPTRTPIVALQASANSRGTNINHIVHFLI